MAERRLEDAPQKARDLFHKGFSAFERQNLDYAIELLSQALSLEPGLLQARKFLRAAQVARFKQNKPGALGRMFGAAKGMPELAAAQVALSAGKFEKAMHAADRLLTQDPLNPKHGLLFARAAGGAGYPEAAVQTLEIIREHFPEDAGLLQTLGQFYTATHLPREARRCFEKVCELRPNDPDAIKALKDATARESMAGDGWDRAADGGSYRDIIRDEEEAVRLEKESKAVKSADDAESLIADALAKIEADPKNVNYHRALARLYTQNKRYDDAIKVLKDALALNPGDPELDRAVSQTRIVAYDAEIRAMKDAGDEAGAEAKDQEKREFEFNDLQDRVARYPNDLHLKFEWGQRLFENDYITEAIQQFQGSQRSVQLKVKSLYFLALCFEQKGQFDMARDQLLAANAELPLMDATKKDVCYELGKVCEAMGDKDAAATYYKQVYQADISYKDIQAKIDGLYQ